MGQLGQHQKLFHVIFSKKNKNYTLLCRFLLTLEALIHSILICEVKDMESQVLQALGKTLDQKALKYHLKLNFNNFQERKDGKVLG